MNSARFSVASLSRYSLLWGNATGFMDRRSALHLCYNQSKSDQRRFCSKWKPGDGYPTDLLSSTSISQVRSTMSGMYSPEWVVLQFQGQRACSKILLWTIEHARKKDFENLSGRLTPEALEQARSLSDKFSSEELHRLFRPFPYAFPLHYEPTPLDCRLVGNKVMVSMIYTRITMTGRQLGVIAGHFGTVISIPTDAYATSTESWKVIYVHLYKEELIPDNIFKL